MRKSVAAVVSAVTLTFCNSARADEKEALRALVDQAIKAHGGEAALTKFVAYTMRMKGTLHVQNMAIDFTGDLSTQGADQQRAAIDLEIGGQKVTVINVFNRDKGWAKINDTLIEMNKDQVEEAKEGAYASWLYSLVPLKDEASTLAHLGEIDVEGRPAVGIRVSRKGHRDVSMFFDKKTHLLVKTENRVKDDQTNQEVTQETYLSAYGDKGEIRKALKLTLRRDGKPFLEAEISEFKALEKLDESVFDKP